MIDLAATLTGVACECGCGEMIHPTQPVSVHATVGAFLDVLDELCGRPRRWPTIPVEQRSAGHIAPRIRRYVIERDGGHCTVCGTVPCEC